MITASNNAKPQGLLGGCSLVLPSVVPFSSETGSHIAQAGPPYIAENSLGLPSPTPPPPGCQAHAVLGFEPRTLCVCARYYLSYTPSTLFFNEISQSRWLLQLRGWLRLPEKGLRCCNDSSIRRSCTARENRENSSVCVKKTMLGRTGGGGKSPLIWKLGCPCCSEDPVLFGIDEEETAAQCSMKHLTLQDHQLARLISFL